MYIIILLMCINIFICVYKSYKKGIKFALFDLVMLILFYVLFIGISVFLDMFKFNSALLDIKIYFKLITCKYDEIIRLTINMIYKIIAFFVLYLLYPLMKTIIFKSLKLNKKKDNKAIKIGLIKGVLSSFLMLCILNSCVSNIPILHKEKEVSLYQYVLEKTHNDKNVKKALDIIDYYQNSNVIKLTKIKVNDKYIDDIFTNLLSVKVINNNCIYLNDEIENILCAISNVYYQSDGFTNLNNIDLTSIINNIKDNNLIEYYSTFLLSLILSDHFDYDDINLKEELNILSKLLIEIDKTNVNYSNVTNLLSKLKSIEIIGYTLSCNILSEYLSYEQTETIKDKLMHLVKTKSFSKDITIVDELYASYMNILEGFNIKTNINNLTSLLFKTNFINVLLPEIIDELINNLPNKYIDLIDTNMISCVNIQEEVNTILSILNILFIDTGDNMAFDFSMISKVNIDSVLKSNILSNGFIKLLIDATNNKGLLKKYGKFIEVPSKLKEYDTKTHKYNSLWYGNEGELSIILQIVKNALSNVNKKNTSNQNIVNVIKCLNNKLVLNSEVLFYSFNKILKGINAITVNEDSLLTINNQYYIDNKEIYNFINCLANFNLIDYYKVINNDFSNIFAITSNKEIEKQIDIMLNNEIVVSSLSYVLSKIDAIKGIEDVSFSQMCLNNNKIKEVKVINKKELKNLLFSIFKLKLDINYFQDINKLLDFIKSNNHLLADVLDPLHSSYSYLLHNNISYYILESIKIIKDLDVSKILIKYENSLIENTEIIALLNALIIFNSNNILTTNLTNQEVDKISNVIITNKEVLNSFIVKELIMEYISKYS